MVVDGEKTVLPGRVTPVDHVEVDAAVEEGLDNAPIRLEIQHRLPVDEGVRYQQGRLHGNLPGGAVVLQLDPVLFVNHIVGSHGQVGFQWAQEDLRRFGDCFLRLFRLRGDIG